MKKMFVIPFILFLTSCSYKSTSSSVFKCENLFKLTNDFNKRYEENNYLSFIENGYLDVFYDENDEGFNCHYYLKYKSGEVIDEWGNYTSDGKTLIINTNSLDNVTFFFSYYNSPTIDYFLISNLNYEGKDYHLIYVGLYIFSAKG